MGVTVVVGNLVDMVRQGEMRGDQTPKRESCCRERAVIQILQHAPRSGIRQHGQRGMFGTRDTRAEADLRRGFGSGGGFPVVDPRGR